jgi:Family of unknown function (DUF5946)
MFDDFRAREIGRLAPSYASTRLTIDVYSLQHPDRYCASAKSLAAHLTGLAWAMEQGGEEGLRILQQWLNGRVDLVKPPIPALRGALTVADIAGATDTNAYSLALERWARSTWLAYAGLHATAHDWISRGLSTAR